MPAALSAGPQPAGALTEAQAKALPKVELHCHLDGSVPIRAFEEMGRRAPGSVPEKRAELLAKVRAPEQCQSLAEYLGCFGLALELLKDPGNLTLATETLVEELAAENVVYAELRFAPASLASEKMDAAAAVDCVTAALHSAQQRCGVQVQALLCMMRHHSEDENLAVLKLARSRLGRGVCGVDIAGDEAAYPQSLYAALFRAAAADGLPYTIHAGESGSAENVRQAADMGAARIGHGIAAAKDPALVALLAQKGVLLENCPISNLQTSAVPSWAAYPFADFMSAGVKLCVNTDNRTVSNTTLTREFCTLAQHYGFVDAACVQALTLNALKGAFLPDADKAKLAKRIRGG